MQETYFVGNKLELLILEILSFIFSVKYLKTKNMSKHRINSFWRPNSHYNTLLSQRKSELPLVITEPPETRFAFIFIDIFGYSTRNYALTLRNQLTKCTQANPLKDKTTLSVVYTLLAFFQHYGTPYSLRLWTRIRQTNLSKSSTT